MSGRSIFENPPRYDEGFGGEELTAPEGWRELQARTLAGSWARGLGPLGPVAPAGRLLGSLAIRAAAASSRTHR